MDTEQLATSAVIQRLSYCDGLVPFINAGTTEPSWDGHVYVYPIGSDKKADLIRVPVQVKGTKRAIENDAASFSVSAEVSDLRNYLNDGGAIYFVVVICDDRSESIFYKSLLPFDLQRILKDAGAHKTIDAKKIA